MKTLSMLEMRKLATIIPNQDKIVQSCETMVSDLLAFYPLPPVPSQGRHCLLLIGSERGFCGDFNDQLLENLKSRLKQANKGALSVITVGSKLNSHLDDISQVVARIDGASVIEESGAVIEQILTEFSELQQKLPFNSLEVIYYQHESRNVECVYLIPPFEHLKNTQISTAFPPLLNLPADELMTDIMEQYLFFRLHQLFYSSLKTENQQRIRHLESAVDRMENELEQLSKRNNLLRQEQITEEIELIVLNAQQPQIRR